MPLTQTPLPFGLRQIMLYPHDAAGVVGTGVALPVARTLSFSEAVDSEELRGDDGQAAEHTTAPTVEWDMESGGVPLEAVKIMFGGAIVETGVTPNMKKVYNKRDTDERGYFTAVGRAISDSGGDFSMAIWRAKANGNLEGSMEEGSFWLTGASGVGLARGATRDLYDFIQNETATALTTAAPTPATRA